MNIQPTYSSLDYPGKMALVLFIPGCDLRCRYCHNPQLLKNEKFTPWELEEVLDAIDENVDFIDAIVISGGEPLLHVDVVKKFIKKAKKENLLVKLDTNGLHPDGVKKVIKSLDYVAMDVKAPLDEYYKISDVYPKNAKELIKESINVIRQNNVFLECRTTFVPTLLTKNDIINLVSDIDCDMYTLQQFRNRLTFDSSLSTVTEPNPEDLLDILRSLDTEIPEIHLKSNQFGNQTIKKLE
ncbi:MAG: anaerobic ribonucleoside-triphosphate reductase activating protein [Methanosphaera sp. rholeuAM130]|nr:anaerobic ribonucleoside-triphosphate reductase activating protein [Methanosphaera sp.]RAP53155.1 MAG: anaerobic ribonucleoside-triphosphate reductase activating protein [Methanosphaera sp. rholeuAM130]